MQKLRFGKAARHDRSAGQSLAELAIVLPVLLLLLLSILQIGFLIVTQIGLTNATREASRNAASIPVAMATQAAPAASTYYARLRDPSSGLLKRNIGGYDPNRLIESGGVRTRICYFSFTDASGAPAIMARAEVEYSHPLFIPLIAQILDGLDGVSDGGLRLGVTEDIRVGNTALLSTDIGNSGSPICNP